MKIQDLEQLTGLDRATIRYYEKQGLLQPIRMENGYRDYSEAELSEIQKIKLLRRLELPLETIKQLQRGDQDLSVILQEQIRVLQKNMEMLDKAVEICQQIRSSGASYTSMDASGYLEALDAKDNYQPSVKQPYRENGLSTSFSPVRRLLARLTDYGLVSLLLLTFFIVIIRMRPFDGVWKFMVSYGSVFASVPITAWFLSIFGTTPGKWLLGIQVTGANAQKLSYQDALYREWMALRYGYGFGIPVYSIWRMYRSYTEYREYDCALWEGKSFQQHTSWIFVKKTVFAIGMTLILLANALVIIDYMRPKYRGNDLTISEFAANYNYYSKILKQNDTMQSDGNWYSPPSGPNTIVIEPFGTAEKKNEPFRFETEGERITKITYENAWTKVMGLNPLGSRLSTACLTLVMSQKNVNLFAIDDFLNEIAQWGNDTSGHIVYQNIEIRWNIQTENCAGTGGTYYSINKEAPSRLSLYFEIIIHLNNTPGAKTPGVIIYCTRTNPQ